MGSNLLDRRGWTDLSQNFLDVFDQPGPIAGAVGSLATSGRCLHLLLDCHTQILEARDRYGIEHDIWEVPLYVHRYCICGMIFQE